MLSLLFRGDMLWGFGVYMLLRCIGGTSQTNFCGTRCPESKKATRPWCCSIVLAATRRTETSSSTPRRAMVLQPKLCESFPAWNVHQAIGSRTRSVLPRPLFQICSPNLTGLNFDDRTMLHGQGRPFLLSCFKNVMELGSFQ